MGNSGATTPLRILTVCTGNTCRSPMAAGILEARLVAAGWRAEVASAGTLGWSGRPATTHTVAVMAERGIDVSGHVSRRIEPEDLEVDLVFAMTRDHAGAVFARDSGLRSCVFLPAEFVRLWDQGEHGTDGGDTADDGIGRRIRAIGDTRSTSFVGRPAEEVADPAGESVDVYRATAARLDRELSAVVDRITA